MLYSRFTFWSGVDLFFCISGFVIMLSFLNTISSPIIQEASAVKISIMFWGRRLVRLMPAAIFWMGIYLFLTDRYNFYGAFGDFAQNFKDMSAAIFQYANLHGLECWGPNAKLTCGPNGIYWSLSLEEQFYFVFPIIFFIFRKNIIYPLIVLFFFQFFQVRSEWSLLWAFRFDAIILGLLTALFSKTYFYRRIDPKFLMKNKYFALAALILSIFLMIYIPAPQNRISLSVGFLSIICGTLVWLASYQKNYINFEINIVRNIMSWLGSRSYSIYLSHIVAFRLSYEILYQFSDVGYSISEDSFLNLLFISVPLVFVFSEASYRIIEVPSKKWANLLPLN